MCRFVNAITYYGLVLLTTELQNSDGSEAQCTQDGKLNFKSSEFAAVLLTTVAEAPGILLAALFVDNIGRLWCVRGGLTICGAFILSLIGVEAHVGQLALLFLARACVEGTFSVLYIYTPELFPTRFRSFGLAMCNGFARLGGLTAPFLTVYLVESGKTKFAVGLLGSLTVLAGVASFLMPLETKGRDLQAESWRAELRSSEDGNIEECKGRSTIPSNSILSQSSSLGIETKRTRME